MHLYQWLKIPWLNWVLTVMYWRNGSEAALSDFFSGNAPKWKMSHFWDPTDVPILFVDNASFVWTENGPKKKPYFPCFEAENAPCATSNKPASRGRDYIYWAIFAHSRIIWEHCSEGCFLKIYKELVWLENQNYKSDFHFPFPFVFFFYSSSTNQVS